MAVLSLQVAPPPNDDGMMELKNQQKLTLIPVLQKLGHEKHEHKATARE